MIGYKDKQHLIKDAAYSGQCSVLEDLDFADDLAEISGNNTYLQEKTDRLNKYARQTGIKISTQKTKVMTINASPEPIAINHDPLEEVEDFTYLGSVLRHQGQAFKSVCSICQNSAHLEVE